MQRCKVRRTDIALDDLAAPVDQETGGRELYVAKAAGDFAGVVDHHAKGQLATLGKLADFTPRAMFAKNFYEAGGIEALGNDGFKDQAAMITAFKASGAKLAVLCGSDTAYAEQGASAAKALTHAGAIVHLAGRPGELEAALKEAGVKSFAFMGCDVLSTLQATHDSLVRS